MSGKRRNGDVWIVGSPYADLSMARSSPQRNTRNAFDSHHAAAETIMAKASEAGRLDQHGAERRASLLHFIIHARPWVALTAPVIYALIVPFLLLDLGMTLYQFMCFPIYGITRVRRSDYLVFDRARLPYLNLLERMNCAYCSYANGLIAYAREIAARTEQYWCAIKHSKHVPATHERYAGFAEFGDPRSYAVKRDELRRSLTDEDR